MLDNGYMSIGVFTVITVLNKPIKKLAQTGHGRNHLPTQLRNSKNRVKVIRISGISHVQMSVTSLLDIRSLVS